MTETVLVAGITCIAGIGGAAMGVLSAKVGANAQVKQTVIQEYFKKRADTYTAVFRAHVETIGTPGSPEAVLKFRTALEEAFVVAPPETAARLLIFQEAVASRNEERIISAKADLVVFMQKDLVTFTEPKLIKNRWNSPFERFKRFLKRFFVRQDQSN
jgi:hypothetical protein